MTAFLLDGVRALAREAGAVILSIYAGDFKIESKADDSPVTAADRAAEAVILAGLARLTPGIPMVAEEQTAAGRLPDIGGGVFWLVDPLDGTKEFIRRNGEFTVNIALIEDGWPTLGVVYAPALDRLFCGAGPGTAHCEAGGVSRAIAARNPGDDGAVVVVSRFHGDSELLDAYLSGLKVRSRTQAGSSLKFCLLAGGEADLYPRFGRTMEWDTAAGHAVLLAAGGTVTTTDGEALRYGKRGLENPHFIARGL
ncbi:MAG: 3'(2'),5'-bisphosphate nucleotidase CysQ [Alphaproteobacteria bacterium]|nr:3'(2'),5'-bisphosphate nucleotidase CysQ [Alphaproteobacteria bacterium]